MKSFVCVLLLAALVAGEPPRFRQARFRVVREEGEEAGGEKESSKSDTESAPYPAAGYKPSKVFRLPSRQELEPPSTSYGTPDNSYGAPLNTYSAPQTEYGVPKATSRKGPKESEEKEGNDNDSESVESSEGAGDAEKKEESSEEKEEKPGKQEKEGKTKKGEKKENLEEAPKGDAELVSAQGAYYVLLPGSQLQRVQFQTQNDIRNMAYTARLQYRNEDRAPIYYYSVVPQPAAAYQQPTAAYYQW